MVLSCLRSAEGRIRRGEPLISTPALLSPIVQCTQACLHVRAHCAGWSHGPSKFPFAHLRLKIAQRFNAGVSSRCQSKHARDERTACRPSGPSYLPSRIPALKRWAIFGFEGSPHLACRHGEPPTPTFSQTSPAVLRILFCKSRKRLLDGGVSAIFLQILVLSPL